MTVQQINLYQSILQAPKEKLALAQLAKIVGVSVVVLMMANGLQIWLTSNNKEKLQQLRGEQQQLTQELAQLQQAAQRRAEQDNADKLKSQLAERDAQLQNKQRVLALLTGKRFGNMEGFVPQFTGFARQHVEGLWLTGLNLQEGGERLNLRGSTTTPELLPQYLQRLAKEPSLHGIEFKTFVMQRNKDKTQVDFDLKSVTEVKGK